MNMMKNYIKLVIYAVLIISCKNQSVTKTKNSGFIQADGSKIYYEVAGQGEPIVFIHAGVTDSRMWDFQVDDLSQNFKVIRFDQRGFGKSGIPERNYNPIQDILALMDSCHIESAHMVGISLGALQAIDLAVEHPERVKTLIISGASFPDWHLSEEILAEHIDFTRYVMENGPDSAVQRMLTDPFWSRSIPDKKYTEGRKLFEQILQENKNSFTVNWQFRELPVGLVDSLGKIDCPVLMFRPGNEMPSIKPIADTLADKIPDIQIAEIPDVSHLLNMEKPGEFNRFLLEFINGHQ